MFLYLFVQQHRRACVYGSDCVAGGSVRLHISPHTWHGDLAAMETLLAGDWLRASTHRAAYTPTQTRSKFKLKKALCTSQNSHKHSVTCGPVSGLHKQPSVNIICQTAVKLLHVTFNWPLICSHMLAAPTDSTVSVAAACFTAAFPILGTSLATCKQFMICGVFHSSGQRESVLEWTLIPQLRHRGNPN